MNELCWSSTCLCISFYLIRCKFALSWICSESLSLESAALSQNLDRVTLFYYNLISNINIHSQSLML